MESEAAHTAYNNRLALRDLNAPSANLERYARHDREIA